MAPPSAGQSMVDNEGPIDLKKAAVLGDPIVGVEVITQDHRGQGAIAARPLPSPREPTQAAIGRAATLPPVLLNSLYFHM